MFYKTFLVFLILSLNAMAANLPPVVNVQQFGGAGVNATPGLVVPEGNTQGYKTLIASVETGGTANAYWAFSDPSTSTAQYAVPNAKTFYVQSICIISACSVTTDCGAMLGTATAAFTSGSATAPTGAFYWGSTSAPTGTAFTIGASNAPMSFSCAQFPISIAQNLIPFLKAVNSPLQTAYLIGKEL